MGHPTLASYLAIADGEAIGRVKFEMTEVRNIMLMLFWALTYSGCNATADASALWATSQEGRRLRKCRVPL